MSDARLAAVREKYAAVERERKRLEHTGLAPSAALQEFLAQRGSTPAENGATLADLLRRPQVRYDALAPFDPERPALPRAVRESVEIRIKYDGYIRRQARQVEDFARMEARTLPADLDYETVTGLRLESRQKLNRIRPENFGQASRISGVSPADIAALMVFLENRK